MSLNKLVSAQPAVPADFDVQQTDFTYDVFGRYIFNDWGDLQRQESAILLVIGAGMFGGYIAEKLYRMSGSLAMRILILDAGAFDCLHTFRICHSASAAP